MTPAQARDEFEKLQRDASINGGLCPSCANGLDLGHKPNCQWLARLNFLKGIATGEDDPGPLQGPNLKWGNPCGTYEIEIVPGGAWFFYRAIQPNGAVLEIKVPLNTEALAEMQAMLNLLSFDIKVEVPHGRAAGHA